MISLLKHWTTLATRKETISILISGKWQDGAVNYTYSLYEYGSGHRDFEVSGGGWLTEAKDTPFYQHLRRWVKTGIAPPNSTTVNFVTDEVILGDDQAVDNE